jgi:hypothetical protein
MSSRNTEFQVFTVVAMKKSIFSACYLLQAGLLSGLLLDTGNGGDMFLRNSGRLAPDYTALYPRRHNSSIAILFERVVETILPQVPPSGEHVCNYFCP